MRHYIVPPTWQLISFTLEAQEETVVFWQLFEKLWSETDILVRIIGIELKMRKIKALSPAHQLSQIARFLHEQNQIKLVHRTVPD